MTLHHLDLTPTLERSDGSSASLEDDTIVVRDRRGRPILRFGADGVTLEAAEGDLTLAAPKGRVVIRAAEEVDLATRRLAVEADDAELRTTRASLVAERVVSHCMDLAQQVGRWELRAERIAEWADDVYRHAEGLTQLRTGRLRQLVDGAYQVVAKRAQVTCDEDVSLDGNRILLG
ncbi:MAG: DUF3540 domain-containing protein [Myxococcales bacterium]|nr:DUF3540 domain-containing protein [Myxococcales bacterium]